MVKTINDLKSKISDFENFSKFLIENKRIIHKGNLSEKYCELLFGLKLCDYENNCSYDAIDNNRKIVEIKQRTQFGAGMKINVDKIDYVLYVELDKINLLPINIWKFNKNVLVPLKNNRVSFAKAKKNKEYDVWF